jgi:hypothetical protein
VEVVEKSTSSLKIKLKNERSGKYLRIYDKSGRVIDVGGTGGKWTVFIIEQLSSGKVILRSNELKDSFVAVARDGGVTVMKSIAEECAFEAVDSESAKRFKGPTRSSTPTSKAGGGGTFTETYVPRLARGAQMEVCLRIDAGHHLRINPHEKKWPCPKGATGKFARWQLIGADDGAFMLKSSDSGKYLRVHGSDARNCLVDVQGTGGAFCPFRIMVLSDGRFMLRHVRFGVYIAMDVGCIYAELDARKAIAFTLLSTEAPRAPPLASSTFSGASVSMSHSPAVGPVTAGAYGEPSVSRSYPSYAPPPAEHRGAGDDCCDTADWIIE